MQMLLHPHSITLFSKNTNMKLHWKKNYFVNMSVLFFLWFLMNSLTSCKSTTETIAATTGINKVNHVIVIYMENHSFDNLYGEFPGANGLSNATSTQIQMDTATGQPYAYLPWSDTSFHPTPSLPNKAFAIDPLKANSLKTGDLVHRYYQEQNQIDGGKMDKFAAISNAKGLSMGYYHTIQLPMNQIAQQYTLCDNFFHSAFGGSFLNHIWLIAAQTPQWTGAPAKMLSVLDAKGNPKTDRNSTPDYYVVNTSFSVNTPHPNANSTDPATLIPNLTFKTIGDELSAGNVSWAWYTGKWNIMTSGTPASSADSSYFQFHHQPFIYFANYADGTQAKKDHLKDETDFDAAVANGTLPAVSFLKPYGIDNEHPGYADVLTGDMYLAAKINTIKASPIWKDCVIIITYDEHGGFWDHVAPPLIDKWGPGARVPGIIISPFSVPGVDHTQYETVSILAFIEKRWGLQPLGTRDAAANPFTNALKF
jgi:phospholipase C